MPRYCYTDYAFISRDKAGLSELKRLHNNLSKIMTKPSKATNGFGPGYFEALAKSHGLNPKDIPCDGAIIEIIQSTFSESLGFFTILTESAYSPKINLWNKIISQYKGVSFVYRAEEPGWDLFINTDERGEFYPDRFLLSVDCEDVTPTLPVFEGWGDNFFEKDDDAPPRIEVQEYFACFEALQSYFADFTGKRIASIEEMNSYFDGINERCSDIGVNFNWTIVEYSAKAPANLKAA